MSHGSGFKSIALGLIDTHGGRLIKSTGDGLLAVFDLPSQVSSAAPNCSGIGITP